jgi:hypothetical protein
MGALVLLMVFALLVLVNAHGRAQRRKMAQQAYDFSPVNVHGGARFANNDDLRKAGLFK